MWLWKPRPVAKGWLCMCVLPVGHMLCYATSDRWSLDVVQWVVRCLGNCLYPRWELDGWLFGVLILFANTLSAGTSDKAQFQTGQQGFWIFPKISVICYSAVCFQCGNFQLALLNFNKLGSSLKKKKTLGTLYYSIMLNRTMDSFSIRYHSG